jgi:anti-sigma-K factor RskA
MTFHLTDLEVVDALDARLAPARQPHLRRCAECQASVADACATLEALGDSSTESTPAPSAEFWEQFRHQVQARVAHEAIPHTSAWWQGSAAGWGLLAAAAAVLLAVWVPSRAASEAPRVRDEVPLVATVSIDDVRWQLMSEMLAELPAEDVVAVLAPSPLAMDAGVDVLSADERETFRRLLENGLNPGSY